MFFFLSKALGYLITPLVMISLLLIATVFVRSKKWKRITLIGALALTLFFSNGFIANEVVNLWELPTKPFTEVKSYEAAILLTGVAVNRPTYPQDRVYFFIGADRVTHTLQLYKLGLAKKIIISGGKTKLKVDGLPESTRLKSVLVLMGVPDSVIFTDTKSDNTFENAVESKRILDSLKISYNKCLLVTSAFHMRRAVACFKKAGAEMDYFTCDFRGQPRKISFDMLFVPKLDAMLIWQKLLKEWVGLLVYTLVGYA